MNKLIKLKGEWKKMRTSWLKVILCTFLFVSIYTPIAQNLAEASTVKVELDGDILTFDQGAVIKEGRTLVPMRKIFEELGATVEYDSKTKKVTAIRETKKITLTLGNKTAYLNNTKIALDVPAQTLNGRTLVPLRFIGEALGAKVEWQSGPKIVSIKTYTFNETYYFVDRAGNVQQTISVSQFDNEFEKTHTTRELVGQNIITLLLDNAKVFESHHTTALALNGKTYDFYMITSGTVTNGKVTGDYVITVYDPATYDEITNFYGEFTNVALGPNIKLSIEQEIKRNNFKVQ